MTIKIICYILLFFISNVCFAVDYYSSASGSGEDCSIVTPCSLATGLAKPSPGDTLHLNDGTYTDELSGVANGTAGNYVTIKALNDGGVTITGSLSLSHTNTYIQFEGLKWNSTTNKTVLGNHIKFLRCAFQGGAATDNNVNVSVGSNDYNDTAYILFEDCWAYGLGGRYKFLIYNSDKIVLRRVIIRDDAGWTDDASNPEAGLVVYQSSNVSLQNVIVVDSNLGTYDENNVGAFYVTGHAGNRSSNNAELIGCMVISNARAAFNVDTDDGSNGVTLTDCVGYDTYYGLVTSNTSANITATRLSLGLTSAQIIGEWGNSSIEFIDSVLWNGSSSSLGSSTATYTNTYNPSLYSGTGITHIDPLTNGLLYLTRIEDESTLKTDGSSNGQRGAQIVYKIGIDGTLHGDTGYNAITAILLWPWPYEDRIKTDMESVDDRGFTAYSGLDETHNTLTTYIWEYLGNEIPADIYGDPPAEDTTDPTVSSSVIPVSGTTWVVTLSENVTTTGTGWSLSCDSGQTATFSSETNGVMTFTTSATVLSTATCTYSYNPATGDTLDGASNEVAEITDVEVTNNSGATAVGSANSITGSGAGVGGTVGGSGVGNGGFFIGG